MRGWLLLAFVGLSGCSHLVWYGRSSNRRHVAAVLERGARQLVRHDFRDGPEFKGVGVDALQLLDERLVYPAELEDGRWVVVVDGVVSEPFESIGEVAASRQRVLVAGIRKGRWVVEVFIERPSPLSPAGGEGEKSWDEVMPGSLLASDRGAWAFAARRENKTWAVVNGVTHGPFDAVGGFTLAGDDVAFLARTTGGVALHVGAQRFGPYEELVEPVSAEGQVAFAFRRDGAWFTSSGAGPFSRVAGLQFLGGQLAFAARREGKQWVVHGAREFGPFQLLKRQLLETPQGLLFAGKRADGWWVRRGETESGPWDDVSSLSVANGHDAFIAERGERSVVVIDGVERGAWEEASSLVLSPDGSKFLHAARVGTQQFLVVDGEPRPQELLLPDTLAFSRDGAHFGCITGERKTKRLFITFDDGGRVPVDLEELTAALSRVPPHRLATSPERALLSRWVEAELQLHFRRAED